jgi:hypothetical protein
MAGVASQHRYAPRAFRPAPDEWSPAEEILKTRGIVPGMFLRACLRWLASDPDAALALLASHWPDPRPLGRPRARAKQGNADRTEGSDPS